MQEYVLLFRMDITNENMQPTKQQMEIYMQQWMEWMSEMRDKGQLADGGNHFSREGSVLRSNNEIIHTPYIAESNSLAGYIIITANNMDDAIMIASKCPILSGNNTSVEIRQTASPGE
jgi:hypothetical protein